MISGAVERARQAVFMTNLIIILQILQDAELIIYLIILHYNFKISDGGNQIRDGLCANRIDTV